MKCLHILPMNKLSGAEKLALLLCKNMKKYEPVVVCGGENLQGIFIDNGIRTYAIDFQKRLFSSLKELKKIIQHEEIKLIHAHDNNASMQALLVKKVFRLDIKVISHIHSCYQWLSSENKNKIIDSFLRKRYDYNIACGQFVFDYYKKYTNYLNEENTAALSNAIDMKEISNVSDTDKQDIINKLNIKPTDRVIGYVGRLTHLKGLLPFIYELNNAKEQFNNCKFLIVGSGDQEEEIKSLIQELNLEEYFILVGHTNNPYQYYLLMDIFFLPSLYEGLPMVILEAMGFQKPVITMDVGSVKELVKDNYNGYVIPNGNTKLFVQRLYELIDNPQLIQRYGEHSLSIVKENYDIHQYVSKVIQIYDKVT